MKRILLNLLLLALAGTAFAQKQVYIPRFLGNMDFNNNASQWCNERSLQNEDIVVFWEAGFGADPSKATGAYTVNMTTLMSVAQNSYNFYRDSLKFAIKGSSVTDKYKLMIFLLYSTTWNATGSGQDDLVGVLHVNPAAARGNTTVAHEIGHCFQYIAGCDTDGGYRYGLGVNGAGGNGFWEQCAQWMAYKVYPMQQFSAGNFNNYIKSNHLHILHETPRYANYFIQDYWAFKRGKDFVARLWRESKRPEDPIETYKRLNSINQEQFNNEIFEHAALLTTWDLPSIRTIGANYINNRPQVAMNLTADNYWMVAPDVCLENYGYNSIKLNAPAQAATVTVRFKGNAGQSGYRALNVAKGGWKYGFVALLRNGTRVYSSVGTAKVTNGINPEQTLSFNCPANCTRLWLVVSGAPQDYWKHAWDDDNTNDEQWPYQVQFDNTNLLGAAITGIQDVENNFINIAPNPSNTNFTIQVSQPLDLEIYSVDGKLLMSKEKVTNLKIGDELNPGVYIVKAGNYYHKIVKE